MGRRLVLLIGCMWFMGLAAAPLVHAANIDTIYADPGIISGTSLINGSCGAFFMDTAFTGLTPPEGSTCFKTTTTADTAQCGFPGYVYWGICYSTTSPHNFSVDQASGEMRFWLRSSTNSVRIETSYLLAGTETKATVFDSLPGWNWATDHDQWKEYRLPLSVMVSSGVDYTQIVCPMYATAYNLEDPTTFYADFVRFTSSSTVPIFDITLKNISNNATTTQIVWSTSTVVLPQGWTRADQYIQLDLDPDTLGWGLQIYTDNKASDANPSYSGSGDPSGLIDSSDNTKTLSMAWTIHSVLAPATGADPNNTSDPNSFQWIFFKDRGTAGFSDGDSYIAVKENLGIQFGVGGFGAANSPNYLYVEANFLNAVTPRTYKTSTVRLEYYHL